MNGDNRVFYNKQTFPICRGKGGDLRCYVNQRRKQKNFSAFLDKTTLNNNDQSHLNEPTGTPLNV